MKYINERNHADAFAIFPKARARFVASILRIVFNAPLELLIQKEIS